MVTHLEAAEDGPAVAHVLLPEAQPAVDLGEAFLDLLRAQQQRIHIAAVLLAPSVQAAQRIHLPLEPKPPCTDTRSLVAAAPCLGFVSPADEAIASFRNPRCSQLLPFPQPSKKPSNMCSLTSHPDKATKIGCRTDDVHGLAQQQVVDIVHLLGARLAQVLYQNPARLQHLRQSKPGHTTTPDSNAYTAMQVLSMSALWPTSACKQQDGKATASAERSNVDMALG